MFHVVIGNAEMEYVNVLANEIEKRFKDKELTITKFDSCWDMIDFIKREGSTIDVLVTDLVFGNNNILSDLREKTQIHNHIKVVFVSDYPQFVFEAYKVEHVYFLRKPLDTDAFQEAMERALNRVMKKEKSFVVKSHNKLVRLPLSSILYFESNARIITVHMIDRDLTFYAKLDEVEEELKEDFIRCHQSFLVNSSIIAAFNRKTLTMKNGKRLPVSNQRYERNKQKMMEYVKAERVIK